MNKDFYVYLEDVITSCSAIAKYIQGKNKEEFAENEELQDAVIRRLEIIGEAIKRLPNEFRTQHSEIKWKGPTGMRDILIHMYDEVDINQVWYTITEVLPPFKEQLVELFNHV